MALLERYFTIRRRALLERLPWLRRRALVERLPYAAVPYWSVCHTLPRLIGAFTIRGRRALLERLPYAADPPCLIGAFAIRRRALLERLPML